MLARDYRDVAGGLMLTLGGLAFSLYALGHYEFGTLQRMGPGFFPAMLGLVLAVLGAAQLVPALFRQGKSPEFRGRSFVAVLLSVAAFALLIRPLGLLPAIAAVIALSSFAERKFNIRAVILQIVLLSALSWVVFKVGLNMSLSLFSWPF